MATYVVRPDGPAARHSSASKGDFGKILLIAGSRGLSGAAVLCGSAALRSGGGLVRVACPLEIQPVVASFEPSYMTEGIPHHADGTYSEASIAHLLLLAERYNVVAVGPGLGVRSDISRLVQELILAEPKRPLVVDADGLTNAIPSLGLFIERTTPAILTPHMGEFARLLGVKMDQVKEQREQLATEFAAKTGVIVLLKGNATLVTDGQRLYKNSTGNPGMATGGTGDVLTGVIAALLGQGLSPFDAAAFGAWIHGRAGDMAAQEKSQIGMTARDLMETLPKAFHEYENGRGST